MVSLYLCQKYGGRLFEVSGSLTITDTPFYNNNFTTNYITLDNGRGTSVSNDCPTSGKEGVDYLAVTGGYLTGGSCTNSYEDGSTMTEEKVTQKDGTITEKTEVVSSDGSKASSEVTTTKEGTKTEKSQTVSADGNTIASKERPMARLIL